MTEKKLSRRDAMKVLGAAVGAVALSTLPSKWNTPELAAGVLPAHARQSGGGGGHTFVLPARFESGGALGDGSLKSYPYYLPNDPHISRHYIITTSGGVTITSPDPLTGDITNLALSIQFTGAIAGDTIVVTWTFTNASDGSGAFVDAFVFEV